MSYWTDMLGGQVRYVNVNGVRTRILEAGDEHHRRALIMLHGQGGHAENWIENLVPLSAGGHAIAPDMLGHGWNDRPQGIEYGYHALLDHIEGLIKLVGAEETVLLGMSLGSTIAGRIAVDRPELVQKLVMTVPPSLNPDGLNDPPPPPAPPTETPAASPLRDLFANPSPDVVRQRFERIVHNPAVVTDEIVATRVAMLKLPGAMETVTSVTEDIGRHRHEFNLDRDALERIACPTLLVWGRYDQASPDIGERAAKLIPDVEYLVLENSGHWPHLEDKEEFEQATLKFLGD